MATTPFDVETARENQKAILDEVIEIRNIINKEVINYYYDLPPQTDGEEQRHREAMRKYLRIVSERIRELLEGKLY